MMAARRVGAEAAGDHCTQDLVFAARHWTMEAAAAAMVRGGFRHLVVVEGPARLTRVPHEDAVPSASSGLSVPPGLSASSGRAAVT
jgi:hypothetical protein